MIIRDTSKNYTCQGVRTNKLPVAGGFATIIGSAVCLNESIERYGCKGDIFAVNHVAVYFNDVYQHLVTMHTEFIRPLVLIRKKIRNDISSNEFKTHVHSDVNVSKNKDLIDYVWNFNPIPQSSGGLAIYIAIALGYDKIMLHGIPLDGSKRFHDIGQNIKGSNYYGKMFRIMEDDNTILANKDKIRSSSGNTMKFFGAPTMEWINEN